ncbi:hypothetical protein, partial [uncultured Microbulbifer sp.]|uniref:hypothetical protein n=1 Tax=uncultured Microbulbifer sp. TaxID=348147 RepID=UPI00260E2987
ENQSLILPSRCALRCRSSSEGANYTEHPDDWQAVFSNFLPARQHSAAARVNAKNLTLTHKKTPSFESVL